MITIINHPSIIKINSVYIRAEFSAYAKSYIEYNTDLSYSNITNTFPGSFFCEHLLENLTAGTTYNYRIVTSDYNNIIEYSANYQFTTLTQVQYENTIKASRIDGALSKQYYVSPTGSDTTGNGSITNPWGTPSYAGLQLDNGDILYIRAGTWENEVITSKSGIAIAPITISSYQNEAVVLNGTSSLTAGFSFNAKHDIVISGEFTINGYVYSIAISNGAYNNRISGLKAINQFGDGLTIGGLGGKWNRLSNTSVFSDGVSRIHGMYIANHTIPLNTITEFLIIENCSIDGPTHNGIDLHDRGHKVLIYNCSFIRCSGSQAIFLHNVEDAKVVISNCIITNGTRGIGIIGASDIVIENCTINNSTSENGIIVHKEDPAYGWTPPGSHRIYIRDTIITNSVGSDIFLWQLGGTTEDGISDVLIERCTSANIELQGNETFFSNITIRDIVNNNVTLHTHGNYITNFIYEYTEGKIFKSTSIATINNTPTGSRLIVPRDSITTSWEGMYHVITSYNIYILPQLANATNATYISYNPTLALGSIVAAFNANCNSNDTATLKVDKLKVNTNYQVNRNSILYTTTKSNRSGDVYFQDNIWTLTPNLYQLIEVYTPPEQTGILSINSTLDGNSLSGVVSTVTDTISNTVIGTYSTPFEIFVIPGDYKIEGTYNSITDTKYSTVSVGLTSYITLQYTSPIVTTGTLNITTTPVSGDIYIDGTKRGTGTFVIEVTPGIYIVGFGYVNGYVTPLSKQVSVTLGNTTNVEGLYNIYCPIPVCNITITQI